MSRKTRGVSVGTPDEPASTHMHFRLHENTESNGDLVRDYGNGSFFTNDVYDITNQAGTAASYSGGRIDCAGDQDNEDQAAALRSFLRLDTLEGVGGILIMCSIVRQAAPASGANTILFAGHTDATAGGWSLIHNAGGPAFQIRYRSAGGDLENNGQLDPGDSNAHTYAWYIDCTSASGPVVYSYLDGVLDDTSSNMATPYPSISATRVFSLFCEQNTDGANGDFLNSNSEDVQIGDLWLVRFESDMQASIAAIAAEFAATPREDYLRTLAGQ